MSQDNTIPRNLTDSLFNNFELPEVSHIVPKNNNKTMTLTQSKYAEGADDDFLMLQLQQHSKVVHKMPENVPSDNSNKSKSTQQQVAAPPSRVITYTKAGRRNKAKKPEPEAKKEIDIDNQIGEIAEWAEKGAKNNSDDEQFNQTEKVGETAEQLEIKKKLEEKLKTGFNSKNKTGGLLAKAAQLKKQNEAKTTNADKPVSAERLMQSTEQAQTKGINEEHETSAQILNKKQSKKDKVVMQIEESEDDPWQKINQNTIQQYTQAKQKRKNMSYDSVINYYQNDFQVNEQDIEIEETDEKQQVKKQQPGCLELLFSCFSSPPTTKKKQVFNVKVAKRLTAISKKQLSSGEQEFFILKQIWTTLTGDPFSRYGSHWNKVGFQGRDPATDLRSTGVLSILQWFIFIHNHEKLAKEYAQWSIQNQFPLALTHIKITGVFLDLIGRSSIRGENWVDFQRAYNAMTIAIFKKLKSTFKGGEALGTLVEQQVKHSKKTFQRDIQLYNQQFKK